MPIDQSSPLWAVLAEWVKIRLTLPDPPPEALVQVNDVAILTAISALSERLSPKAAGDMRNTLAQVRTQLKVAS